jgi:(p)ppGpp synthase/HD superfamily hydrolase
MKELIQKAEEFATRAHSEQKRWGGEPYIIHPRSVAQRLSDPIDKVVAWLHDTLEDTKVTENALRKEFSDEIVNAVVALTKKPGESYLPFVLRSKSNPIACRVKIADIKHNLGDGLKPGSMRDKYLLAIYVLEHDFIKAK